MTKKRLSSKSLSIIYYFNYSNLVLGKCQTPDYAAKKHVPFISITGADEISRNVVNLKNLATGEQVSVPSSDLDGIISFLFA